LGQDISKVKISHGGREWIGRGVRPKKSTSTIVLQRATGLSYIVCLLIETDTRKRQGIIKINPTYD